MTKFSANLGFLWSDRTLPQAIYAAKTAGFDAVECHWPYRTPTEDVGKALNEARLSMVSLNTVRGNTRAGDNGLAAIPGRDSEARKAIRQALGYATDVQAGAIHVMAGRADGAEALSTCKANLKFASDAAKDQDATILIEPLNAFDAPGYFLRTTDQARAIIDSVGASNLKLMFDCYHVARAEGDLIDALKTHFSVIGHIQFASVPDRGPPDHGDVDYRFVFAEIAALGWDKPLGAEYRPSGEPEATLGWMETLNSGT